MEQGQAALYLAIYGAVLSTIVMIWNIKRDIKDRADIKVNVNLVERGLMDVKVPYICVELSNTGKRPITVIEIHYRIEKNMFPAELSKSQDLPKELGEGQFYSTDIMKENIKDLSKVEFFIAKDARGKRYWSNKYPLKG